MITPRSMASEKLNKTSPPKTNSASRTAMVVTPVSTVRDNVSLIEMLSNSSMSIFL